MPEDPLGTERAPLPTLLRRARRAYAEAIQSALADSGCDDVPRNGAFVLGATAATGAQLSQIIRELRVSKQAAGQLIDTLVSRGYLVRSVDPADRRRLNITLTERGLAAAGVIGAAVGAVDERLAGRVSPADVQAARRVLGALIDLEADPEADPGGDGGPPDHGSAHDHGHPHEHRHPHDHRHPRDHGHPHYHGGGDLAELAGPRLARTGLDRLGEHLAATYGITVTGLAELDLGVYQVDRGDGGSWVARVLPAVREAGRTAADRDVLRFAESAGFPAERCAAAEPVSVLDGQDVLVTDYVPGLRGERRQEVIRARGGLRRLGDLLGWLHVLPGGAGAAAGRDGGAWHHLADGGPSAEIAAARAQLTAAASRVPAGQEHLHASLLAELAGLDDGAGLPQALAHPDFVLANVIATADRGMILVDWTGAGRGPRLWPLAFLLYSAAARDLRRVDRVLDGYRRRVTLEPAEVDRMAAVARARPVVLQSWLFCAGRQDLPGALAAAGRARELADAMAVRVRAALGG